MTSAEYAFVTVQKDATLASVKVAQTLTVTGGVCAVNQNIQNDSVTTTLLEIMGTGGTPGGTLGVDAGTGNPLAITSNSDTIVCQATTTEVRGGALTTAYGVTVTATFPTKILTFTSGVLTSATNPSAFKTSMDINTGNMSVGSTDDHSFALPLIPTGNYNFVVTWGDGSASTITAYDQPDVTHLYAATGTYTVEITGTLTGWTFNGVGDCLKLTNINSWGPMVIGAAGDSACFAGCANLAINPAAGSPVSPATIALASCFQNCTSLNSTNLATWDVSAVQDISYMFAGASAFNVNLSSWNTSAVQDMGGVFSDCTAFNNGDAGNTGTAQLTWQTGQVTDVSSMFLNCTSFNQTVAFTWGTELLDCSYLFSGCTIFNNGNISNTGTKPFSIATPLLQVASGMFLSCASFNQTVTFSSASQLVQVDQMFQDASVFNNGDTSDAGGHPIVWATTSALVSLVAMFHNATAFNQTVTLSSVGRTSSMFYGASRFNNGNITNAATKPLTLTFNSSFTNGNYMFSACTSFNQQITFAGNMSVVQDLSSAFTSATLFNNGDLIDAGLKPMVFGATSSLTDTTQMFAACSSFNQTVTFGDLSSLQFAASMFEDTSVFNNGDTSDAGGHPIAWTTPALLSASSMFNSATSFNQTVTLSSLGTTADGMFNFAARFNNGNITNAGTRPFLISSTALDTNVSSMFYGCTSFNQTINMISFNGFSRTDEMFFGATLFNNGDTLNAGARPLDFGVMSAPLVNANSMFSGAAAFNQTVTFADLTSLQTAVTMFQNAALFNNGNTADAGSKPITWPTTSTLTDISQMFAGCGAFNQTLSLADMTGVTTMANMFFNCALFNNGSTVDDAAHAIAWTTSNNLANTSHMFHGCAVLNQTVSFSDTTGVTTIASMFNSCSLFNNGGLALTFTTTSALTDASFMFRFCSVFNQTFVLSNTTGVTSMAWMFTACALFNNGSATNDGLNPLTFTTSSALRDVSQMFILCEQFNQTLLLSNTTGMTAMAGMFFGCGIFNNGVTSNAGGRGLTFTTTSALAEVELMFNDCAAFNQEVVLSDMTGITTTGGMFLGCSVFNNGDTANVALHPLTLTTTSALTNTSNMFSGCSVFNQKLNVSNLSGVLTAESMFSACTLFNNGDTTNMSSKALVWTTSTLLNTTSMFANCAAFNQALTFSDMSHVGDMGSMLQNCNLFKQDLSAWQVTACANFNNFYTGDINNPNSLVNQTNYDALLTSWAAQAVRSSVIFTMGTSKYSAAVAGAARTTLTGTYSWTVNDGGAAP